MSSSCPSGTSCIDVPLCTQQGGTCVQSCSYGCCCLVASISLSVSPNTNTVQVNNTVNGTISFTVNSGSITNPIVYLKYVSGPDVVTMYVGSGGTTTGPGGGIGEPFSGTYSSVVVLRLLLLLGLRRVHIALR